MKIKFLDLVQQHKDLKIELDREICKIFKKADFIKGRAVKHFEEEFSKYCGVRYCIGCGNGTDALASIIKAMDLKKGSAVIVPANTFIATAEAVAGSGLKVRFADIDEDYTVSPESVENLMDKNVSAIVAVHIYGLPAKMRRLKNIADKWGVYLIEDAAQAHGAEISGKRTGSLADAAAFSFYPGKVLGAAGDAGAVTVNDVNLYKKVKMICDHGRTEKYFHVIPGINSRLDSIQAAVLTVKLKYLEKWIGRRNEVAKKYGDLLKNINWIKLPETRNRARHVWHLFVIRTEYRNQLREYLEKDGIECGIHYPLSLPQQPVFKDHIEYCKEYRAVKWSLEYLSLPIGEHLSDEMVEHVVSKIKNYR